MSDLKAILAETLRAHRPTGAMTGSWPCLRRVLGMFLVLASPIIIAGVAVLRGSP